MSATETTTTVDPSELVPLEPACEWRSSDLGDRYVYQLTDEHIAELDAALIHAEGHTDDVLDITRELFPLADAGRRADPADPGAHRRCRSRAHPRRAGRAVHEGPRLGDLLGGRDVPGPAVAAEREGPPARRRDRPGQGARRSPPRAATRSVASRSRSTPTARISSGSSASTPARRREPRRERGDHPQRARAHGTGARGGALRAVPVRLARGAGSGVQAVVHDADLQPLRGPVVRALHPPVHRGDSTPRGRAAAVRRGARSDEPRRRDVRGSRVPRIDDDGAR